MTVQVQTLIDNSRSIASTTADNLSAFKDALSAFVGSQYPVDKSLYDHIARTYKTADYRYRQPTTLAATAAAMPDGGYTGIKLPNVPDWIGLDEFAIETGIGGVTPFDQFMVLLEDMFPSAADVAEVHAALQLLIDNPPTLDSAVTAANVVTTYNRTQSIADLQTLFSLRGMPTPAGYSTAAEAHVTALHVERAYDGADDRVYDDTMIAEVITARVRALASGFADMLGARSAAISAVGAYLDATISSRKVPYDIAEAYAETELGVYNRELEDAASKLGFNAMLRNSLLDYFQATAGYQREAQRFTAATANLNVDANAFITNLMTNTGDLEARIAGSEASAYSRKAAAAVSAMGSILSSVVSSFG